MNILNRKSAIVSALLVSLLSLTLLNFKNAAPENDYKPDAYVHDVLRDLGAVLPSYYPETISPEEVEKGRELVFQGRTTDPKGGKSQYISLYYVCTNCHNTVIEESVLSVNSDPEARLDYAIEHKLPFLQGTTFYGISNRESWYNDDYYKKYGDLVKAAKVDLRESIQLCAKECSKGRYLEKWEESAILSYYLANSYRLSDIFSTSEIEELNSKKSNAAQHPALVTWIKSKYALKSPAAFVEPPYDQGNNLPVGDPARGKAIYELSCQNCHKAYGCSDNVFDNSSFTFKKFNRDFDKDYWWLFKAVRHGFYGYPGHEPYMPHYTAERMSDKQVMDLKAYFLQQAS
ncbi:MAG: cytochrome c [Chitinophagales bacterium]